MILSPRCGSLGKKEARMRKSRLSILTVTPYSFSARKSVRPKVAFTVDGVPLRGIYSTGTDKHLSHWSLSHSAAALRDRWWFALDQGRHESRLEFEPACQSKGGFIYSRTSGLPSGRGLATSCGGEFRGILCGFQPFSALSPFSVENFPPSKKSCKSL